MPEKRIQANHKEKKTENEKNPCRFELMIPFSLK